MGKSPLAKRNGWRNRRALSALPSLIVFLLVYEGVPAGAVAHDETVHGDLSNDPAIPTPFQIDSGNNTIAGSSAGLDPDFVNLVVPSGLQVDALVLDHYPGPFMSFLGVQSGSQWLGSTDESIRPADLLGWTHFGQGNDSVGTDLLDDIATGAGSTGFVPPLSAGNYVQFLREALGPESYSMTFQVSSVPEPLALGSAFLWAACILVRRACAEANRGVQAGCAEQRVAGRTVNACATVSGFLCPRNGQSSTRSVRT